MDLKEFFDNDRAVSPVIGVILMVAITVILAAVIGSFVLGLGDSLSQSAPSVAFDGDQGTTTVTVKDPGTPTTEDVSATSLTIVAESGDTVDFANLDVAVDGTQAVRAENTDPASDNFENAVYPFSTTGTLSAGTSVTIVGYDSAGIGNNTELQGDGSNNFNNISPLSTGETVTITWSSSDGSSSSLIFESEIN